MAAVASVGYEAQVILNTGQYTYSAMLTQVTSSYLVYSGRSITWKNDHMIKMLGLGNNFGGHLEDVIWLPLADGHRLMTGCLCVYHRGASQTSYFIIYLVILLSDSYFLIKLLGYIIM